MSAIPAWAVRGAKVVCVDDAFVSVSDGGLRVGREYQIKRAYCRALRSPVAAATYVDDHRMVQLVGVSCPTSMDGGYALARFRPAVEPKSEVEDLALFRHHLDQRQPVDA